MKLKNKLLSIGAALLLSCQYAPAQAQIVDNSLNPTGVKLTWTFTDIQVKQFMNMSIHKKSFKKSDNRGTRLLKL